jgi:hypothetical protein
MNVLSFNATSTVSYPTTAKSKHLKHILFIKRKCKHTHTRSYRGKSKLSMIRHNLRLSEYLRQVSNPTDSLSFYSSLRDTGATYSASFRANKLSVSALYPPITVR